LRDIRVVDAIPVSAAGKVLRRELREVVEQEV
jgi:acyl-coenzyme A synthetase/AMP-(fatty) acid ligase